MEPAIFISEDTAMNVALKVAVRNFQGAKSARTTPHRQRGELLGFVVIITDGADGRSVMTEDQLLQLVAAETKFKH